MNIGNFKKVHTIIIIFVFAIISKFFSEIIFSNIKKYNNYSLEILETNIFNFHPPKDFSIFKNDIFLPITEKKFESLFNFQNFKDFVSTNYKLKKVNKKDYIVNIKKYSNGGIEGVQFIVYNEIISENDLRTFISSKINEFQGYLIKQYINQIEKNEKMIIEDCNQNLLFRLRAIESAFNHLQKLRGEKIDISRINIYEKSLLSKYLYAHERKEFFSLEESIIYLRGALQNQSCMDNLFIMRFNSDLYSKILNLDIERKLIEEKSDRFQPIKYKFINNNYENNHLIKKKYNYFLLIFFIQFFGFFLIMKKFK